VVPVVERLLSQSIAPGAISHLEYATRLLVVPTVIFDGALAPSLLAEWTGAIAGGTQPTGASILAHLRRGVTLAAVCALPLFVFAPQYVVILLQHGRFTAADAVAVSALLRVLGVGFVGSMGAMLLERLYLAQAANRTLAVLAFVRGGTRLGIAVAFLASRRLLAFGIGYAVAEWIYFILLVVIVGTPQGPMARTGDIVPAALRDAQGDGM